MQLIFLKLEAFQRIFLVYRLYEAAQINLIIIEHD